MTRAPVVVPPGPLTRVARAGGSLLLLAALIVGLPVALTLFGGDPTAGSPAADGLWSALTTPDDGTLFLRVLTVLGWLAWAGFTGSVILELLARATDRPTPSVPGLSGPQRVAAVLIAAIAALAVSPTVTSTHAAAVPPAAVQGVTVPDSLPDAEVGGAGQETGQRGQPTVHVVARGEGLLDLQDRYGVPWQRIAEANYERPQPDGRSLRRGQIRIYPGWRLRIPPLTASSPDAARGTADRATDTDRPPALAGVTATTGQRYRVAPGDWLWHIADRFLGDPERYREIAELNPAHADRHGGFPDHIEPGWTLILPPDAVDRGVRPHATGDPVVAGADAAPARPDRAESPRPDDRGGQAAGSPTAPPVAAGLGTAPPRAAGLGAAPPQAAGLGTAPPAAGPSDGPTPPAPGPEPAGHDQPDEPGGGVVDGPAPPGGDTPPEPAVAALEELAPAMLAGAGLLSAMILSTVADHRHRRRQFHRPGLRPTPAGQPERAARTAAQSLDTVRLHAALRQLTTALADRADLPDIAGALVDRGSVQLLLTSHCPDPPPPWREHGDRWVLPAGATLPEPPVARPAPLPLLTAVGSQAGIHLLLDLERTGVLTVRGGPDRTGSLLRYLAAELAAHEWADACELLLAGFPPEETELLVELAPDRVRPVADLAAGAAVLRQRLDRAGPRPGTGDAFTDRVRGVAADAWIPQVLVAADASSADLAALTGLEREIGDRARCGVAVAVAADAPAGPETAGVSVTDDGTVHVRLPYLRVSATAAALSRSELTALAQAARAARTAPLVPVPSAPEPEPWAVGTDAAGALRSVGRARVGQGPAGPPEPVTHAPVSAKPPPDGPPPDDPVLDDDLRAWYDDHPARPRIGVLGPVRVDAPGPAPHRHLRLPAELVVFLAQRGARGADERAVDAALWPDAPVDPAARQLLIARVRRWLGTDPEGRPWLPHLGGQPVHRLADGYLLDWHLFRRLRTRAQRRGPAGVDDLRAALRLVRGVPLADADQPWRSGMRSPYPWLPGSDVAPEHLVATVVDTAHELAERCLAAADPVGVRWAVEQAWLADPGRGYDQPWRDLLRAEHMDGRVDRLRRVLAELMAARQVETPAKLAPETHRLVAQWPPEQLSPTGDRRSPGG